MITSEELQKLALLAKLEIKEEESASLAAQMERIVAFAGAICTATAPATDLPGGTLPALREDNVLPSLSWEEILKNAAATADGCFVARKRGAAE